MGIKIITILITGLFFLACNSPPPKKGPRRIVGKNHNIQDCVPISELGYTLTCYQNRYKKLELVVSGYGLTEAKREYKYTYYESNGNLETSTEYYSGIKYKEYTHYEENGNPKTYIMYDSDGTTPWENHPECYSNDGQNKEKCRYKTHGKR